MSSKVRDYAGTWNNYTQENYDAVVALDTRYLIVAKEIGDGTDDVPLGTPHLQFYIYFDSPRSFNSIQKLIKGAHFEPRYAKSTPEQASNYCKKSDPDYFERGDLPKQGKRTDVEIVRDQLQAGGGMRGVVKVATNLTSIRIAEMILKYEEPKRDWVPVIIWYWGATNTGKSRQAHEDFKGHDFYRKTSNSEKWWDGYDAHPYVIIDDFVFPENCKVQDYKNWLDIFDRYSCQIQTKGGVRQFLARKIIVTSSRNPYVALAGHEQGGAEFIRRISEIREFTADGNKLTSA